MQNEEPGAHSFSGRFDTYDAAREFAQTRANKLGIYHRIKRTKECGVGREIWIVKMVPSPKQQFGADLQGEAVIPNGKEYCV